MIELRYSVIIPIYNAETTLSKCLDSLAEQVRADTEILLIDDGSADSSSEICKAYTDAFPQFLYYYQENTGVSKARNVGLDMARGDFILFVDSDDYVSQGYFSSIDHLAVTQEADLAMFRARHFGIRSFESPIEAGEWNDIAASAKICDWMREQVLNSLWSKVFKREIIQKNHLRFDETLTIGEDLSFVFAYSLNARRVICDTTVLYHVREENKNSLSRRRIDDLPDKLLRSDDVMRYALKQANLDKQHYRIFQRALARNYYRSAYSAAKQWKDEMDTQRRRKKILEICNLFSKKRVAPGNIENALISLPVQWHMTGLIDLLIRLR